MIRGKRFLSILLIALFLMANTMAFAEGPARLSIWQNVETYVSVNAYNVTDGNVPLTVLAATTALTLSKHRILGFLVVPQDTTKHSELTLGLYDATTAATLTEANVFDEAEWLQGDGTPRWYPYPKKLARGLCFIQGGNTVAIIYYEDITGQ